MRELNLSHPLFDEQVCADDYNLCQQPLLQLLAKKRKRLEALRQKYVLAKARGDPNLPKLESKLKELHEDVTTLTNTYLDTLGLIKHLCRQSYKAHRLQHLEKNKETDQLHDRIAALSDYVCKLLEELQQLKTKKN